MKLFGRALLSLQIQASANAFHSRWFSSSLNSLKLLNFATSCKRNPSPLFLHTSMATKKEDPLSVIQKQLDLYNERDVDKFMEIFSKDAVLMDLRSGAVLAQGFTAIRSRYEERFKTPVHCTLIGRLAMGNVVVDRELITGLPNGAEANCMAIYEVNDGLISKAQFVWEPVRGSWDPSAKN